jgi:uncharacterized membrane protein (UPF0182 family)
MGRKKSQKRKKIFNYTLGNVGMGNVRVAYKKTCFHLSLVTTQVQMLVSSDTFNEGKVLCNEASF